MIPRIAVVYEADADFRVATELADRVLIEAVDWLDEHLIAHQREWIGEVTGPEKLTWKSIPRLARAARIRAHGHIDGNPLEIDAGAARRAILYLKAVFDDIAGIVLIRDQDDQPERRDGLEQARSEHHGSPAVVIGLAVVVRESWVLAGFDPADEEETARHAAERQTLGFDPRMKSEELTVRNDSSAPGSPKRVLAVLCPTAEREARCWRETPLATLRARGANNGLAAYLDEVRARLAPLIGHTA